MDELLHVDKNGAKGTFTFDENLEFYKGHFKTKAVTPGVILIETMAQIGVVCLGIYLLHDTFNSNSVIALTSAQVEFLKPVYPNTKVIVKSEKIYFRFGKLKCKVVLENEKGEALCNGTIAGMISQ